MNERQESAAAPALSFDIHALSAPQLEKLALHLFSLVDAHGQGANVFILHLAQEQQRALADFKDIAESIEPLMQSVPDAAVRLAVKAWAHRLASSLFRNADTVNALCNGWCNAMNDVVEASNRSVQKIVTAAPQRATHQPKPKGTKSKRKPAARRRVRSGKALH